MKNYKITIGRSAECDLVLADATVSRLHAQLELIDNEYLLLTDCQSTQGTSVMQGGKEERVKQRIISEYELLKFGQITISANEILTATNFYGHQEDILNKITNIEDEKFTNVPYQEKEKEKNTESIIIQYFSAKGRASRSTYWLKFIVPIFIIQCIAAFIDIKTGSYNYTLGYGTFSGVLILISFYPGIIMAIKRCHDRERSGWFLLLMLIPLLNIWVLIEIYFLKGTTGLNKYGADTLS